MRMPRVRGLIDRRILLNFRVDPHVLAKNLPAPFRPHLIGGMGLAGVCLIRLSQLRPRVVPSWLGLHSENAAHRMAVEWDQDGRVCHGVYIPRRDTSSLLNVLVGGRLFPGVHQHAQFSVREQHDRYEVAMQSDDGQVQVSVAAKTAERLPNHSVFDSLTAASAFFAGGSLGYSPAAERGVFEGLELACRNWTVTPLAVESWSSSFFERTEWFPSGTVAFDSALLMLGIEHEWHARPALGAEARHECRV